MRRRVAKGSMGGRSQMRMKSRFFEFCIGTKLMTVLISLCLFCSLQSIARLAMPDPATLGTGKRAKKQTARMAAFIAQKRGTAANPANADSETETPALKKRKIVKTGAGRGRGGSGRGRGSTGKRGGGGGRKNSRSQRIPDSSEEENEESD